MENETRTWLNYQTEGIASTRNWGYALSTTLKTVIQKAELGKLRKK